MSMAAPYASLLPQYNQFATVRLPPAVPVEVALCTGIMKAPHSILPLLGSTLALSQIILAIGERIFILQHITVQLQSMMSWIRVARVIQVEVTSSL